MQPSSGIGADPRSQDVFNEVGGYRVVKLRLKPSRLEKGTASPRALSLLAQAPSLAAFVAALRVTPSPR